MEKYADLHLHSIYSEGEYNISRLINLAKKYSLKALALTDHNVTAGVNKFIKAASASGLQAVSGVELYVKHKQQSLHLLGYGFNPQNKNLARMIKVLQQDNKQKTAHSINQLKKQGFKIEANNIFKSPSKNFGVIHLLKELESHNSNLKKMNAELSPKEKGFFGKINHYFGKGQPAHLPLSELNALQAIKIIKSAGGIASLAHPGQQLSFEQDNLIIELVKAGLEGLEVLSPYHNWHQIEHYQALAAKFQLLITGGSDFHGDINFTKKEPITRQWDYFKVPYKLFKQLKNKLKK